MEIHLDKLSPPMICRLGKTIADTLEELTAGYDSSPDNFGKLLVEAGKHTKGRNSDELLVLIAEFYSIELPGIGD